MEEDQILELEEKLLKNLIWLTLQGFYIIPCQAECKYTTARLDLWDSCKKFTELWLNDCCTFHKIYGAQAKWNSILWHLDRTVKNIHTIRYGLFICEVSTGRVVSTCSILWDDQSVNWNMKKKMREIETNSEASYAP